MDKANCIICKKEVDVSEVEKTAALGHGTQYLFWHKEDFCKDDYCGAVDIDILNRKEVEKIPFAIDYN